MLRAAALVLLLSLAPAEGATAQAPVLGAADYMGPYGTGWGEVAPRAFHNGGVPSGGVRQIEWTGWGQPVATGTGKTSLYAPAGGYLSTPGTMELRVEGLGECPGEGRPAYTLLFVRTPKWPGAPLPGWHKWNSTRTICDREERDPDAGKRGTLGCRDVGPRAFVPPKVFDIVAYLVPCDLARRVARTISERRWPRRCRRHGCQERFEGLDCRLERPRRDERVPDFSLERRRLFPAQRVACLSTDGGNFTAWFARPLR